MKEYYISWQNLIPPLVFITLFLISDQAVSNSAQLEQGKTFYFNGQYDKALELLEPVARKQNNAEAQYYTGLVYSISGWKNFDINIAIKYLLSSADQSYAPAMWKIGDIYENSLSDKSNLVLATDWYRKAKQAEKKQTLVQFYKDNSSGSSTPVSNENMINLLAKKAQTGDIEAQLKLGKIYDDGVLIQQDETKAFEWYLKAAKNNNQYAQFMVGYFYCRRIGTDFDLKKADYWFVRSERKAQCVTQ